MRNARKYDKVIQVWRTAAVPDGFGGNTVSETLLGNSFCKITTLNAQRISDLGLNSSDMTIQVDLRNRSDISYSTKNTFFVYKGLKMQINRIERLDLNGLNLRITAVAVDKEVGFVL